MIMLLTALHESGIGHLASVYVVQQYVGVGRGPEVISNRLEATLVRTFGDPDILHNRIAQELPCGLVRRTVIRSSSRYPGNASIPQASSEI